MNKDFHYYGTYAAATVAGFENPEATAIAYAAQYVDDSSAERIFSGVEPYITDFMPVRTVQTNTEIFKNYTQKLLTEELQNETARVWSCFHFLPGNVNGSRRQHTGAKTNGSAGDSWTYDKKAEEQFKLICLTNSEIGREMVNNITDYHKSQQYFLQLVGMRMHILADTWAHTYHAGISAWFLNDAYDVVELGPDMKPKGSPIIWVYDPFFDDNLTLHKYSCTTISPFYNSFSYLGHGRMGHFPDYGFKRYAYRPCWSSTPIQKDNQSDFFCAFRQMVQAMRCIREGKYFNNELASLPKEVEDKVKAVIATEATDQSAAWKKAIADLGFAPPADYDANKLLNEYKKTRSSDSAYYSFNYAAVLHVDLVKSALRRDGVYIDEVPEQNNNKLKLINKGKKTYYGSATRFIDGYDYPKLASPGVDLSFINPGGQLKSGDVVEIKTNESSVDRKFPYVMAWESKALYYQAREFGMNRSKWRIECKSVPVGAPIPAKAEIEIKNVHFTDKPCLQPYHYALPPSGDYLTTDKASGKGEQIWVVEGSGLAQHYYIVNKKSQNVLQVSGASKQDAANIEQGRFNGADCQKFQLIGCGGEYYHIQAVHSGKVLDVIHQSKEQNAQLIQYGNNSGDNQKFKLLSCGDGYFYIVPKHSQMPIGVKNKSIAAGAPIVQFSDRSYDHQKFVLENAGPNQVKIKVVHSGKYVTIKDNSKETNANVILLEDMGKSAQGQIFEMVSLGGDLYALKNVGSGLNLDVHSSSCEDNVQIIQYRGHSGDNQKFYVQDCDGGFKRIISKHAGKCLGARGADKADGTPLVQCHQESPEYEKFRLVCAN